MAQIRQSIWLDARTNDDACRQSRQRRGQVGSSVALLAIVASVVVAGSGRVHAQEVPLGEAMRRLERRLDELERDNKAMREENARLLRQKNAIPTATEKDIGGAEPGLKMPTPSPVLFQPDAPPAPTAGGASEFSPDRLGALASAGGSGGS